VGEKATSTCIRWTMNLGPVAGSTRWRTEHKEVCWAQRRSPSLIPQLPFQSGRPSYIMATRSDRLYSLQAPSKQNTSGAPLLSCTIRIARTHWHRVLINFLQFGTHINDEGRGDSLVCFPIGHSAPSLAGTTILTPSIPSSEPSSPTTQFSVFS
jgi:hypothetical protein